MNLQLALDRLTKEQCFALIEQTKDYVDWIEVGTGVIKEYGMGIIKEVKSMYPNCILVADMKTCDAGKHEAIQAFEAGADITTVMAFSADKTIKDTVEVANQYNKRIMIDLLGVTDKERIQDMINLKVDLVSLHFGKDMQSEGEFQTNMFSLIKDFPQLEVAVAGGISLETLSSVVKENIDTIIVGSAITKAKDPEEVAAKMKGMI